ncbi:MAG: TonB-dependent receptor [Bacteroidetes bacterium]|nr:MAG: TonB-dependent receptor [Bacteroidota bacterium]
MKNITINLFLLFVALTIWNSGFGQNLKGVVYEINDHGVEEPLPGANVYWLGTEIGTVTNNSGKFSIPKSKDSLLVISFIGYKNDTIDVGSELVIKVVLKDKSAINLDEVNIVEKQQSTKISTISSINIETITQKELQKAACCDLSESFETNASVDVHFADAVSGLKQIQLLGLAGTYTQILTEVFPSTRGLATSFGLNYIPGPWMKSIQVTKGTGSVVNGYESITGQINTEIKKPTDDEKLYINLYSNHFGKPEANFNYSYKVNENWKTMLLGHSHFMGSKIDNNGDSFLDIPLSKRTIFMNRWQYTGKKESKKMQFGVKGITEERLGGQTNFNKNSDIGTQNAYGVYIRTKRLEAFTKRGIIFPKSPSKSIGLMLSSVYHDQQSDYGLNNYTGNEVSFYSNLIFQSLIAKTDHQIKLGTSFLYDQYKETFNNNDLNRTEMVPGIFSEFTFTHSDKLDIVSGIRIDYHNLHGLISTPRLHVKYNITPNLTYRVSGGRGFRIANIYADNPSIFSSSRQVNIQETLLPEIAWNFGSSISKQFLLNENEGRITVDFFRTDFQNQIIMDLDEDPQKILFYNLKGESYSNAFQAEFFYELTKRLELKLAYKWQDVKTTYNGLLTDKPMVTKNKGLINLAYSTKYDKWKFDITSQLIGKSRLPNTAGNPKEYQLGEYSPRYYLVHSKITRSYHHWDFYLGGENLLNFKQPNPILAYDDPFSQYFDASMVWGPIVGRLIYAGLNYNF